MDIGKTNTFRLDTITEFKGVISRVREKEAKLAELVAARRKETEGLPLPKDGWLLMPRRCPLCDSHTIASQVAVSSKSFDYFFYRCTSCNYSKVVEYGSCFFIGHGGRMDSLKDVIKREKRLDSMIEEVENWRQYGSER